jgi:hypothetical protein
VRQGSRQVELADDQPVGTVKIVVNVDDLGSFRSLLSRELSENLAPAASRIIGEHARGVGFGAATISDQVRYTRQCYADALSASMNNMARYVQLSGALIDGIHDVMANYREGELTAEELIAAINSRMNSVAAVGALGGPG